MKLTFFYHFYQKHNISSADQFNDILRSLDDSYDFSLLPVRTLHFKIADNDPKIQKLGLMTRQEGDTLYSVIKEFTLFFVDIEGGDRYDIVEHLVEVFGEKATAYKLEEEVFLNEPS